VQKDFTMGRKKHLDYLKQFKSEISKDIPIKKMILFGSRASGKPHRWSDFDLIIVSNKFKNKKFRYRPLLFYDHWTIDYPVDFLCYTLEEFNKFRKRQTIVATAVEEGIEI